MPVTKQHHILIKKLVVSQRFELGINQTILVHTAYDQIRQPVVVFYGKLVSYVVFSSLCISKFFSVYEYNTKYLTT